MASEQERHRLQAKLERTLGEEEAATLMEHLPPDRWDRLATKDDIASLDRRMDGFEQRMVGFDQRMVGFEQRTIERFGAIEATLERYDERFASLEHRVIAEFRRQIIDQNRLLFFGTIGAVFITASLAFAAAQL